MRYNFIAMSALSQATAALIRALFAAAVLVALSAPSLAQESGSRPATEKDIQRVEEDIQRLEEAGKRRDAKLDELTVNMAALSKNMAVLAKEVELQGKRMDMLGKRMDNMQNTLDNISNAMIVGLLAIVGTLLGALWFRREPKPAASAAASQSLSTPSPTKPNVAIVLVTDDMFEQFMATTSFPPGRKPPPILMSGVGPND